MNLLRPTLCLLLALSSLPAFALSDGGQEKLHELQQRWAEINYQTPADAREKAFASLSEQADAAVKAEPKAAELLIWRGIILSTYAGAKGGLGALSLVKEAKASLEQALALDAKALDGSAYTSLGSLYYQVPGWPVGFGDKDKAAAMLKQALAINPKGIDPNYFQADFLYRNGRYDEANTALNKALEAAPRRGREVADAGRRSDIATLQQKIAAEQD
ncbi:MAG: tetratricopeptide repeat protein [Gammaproteobacteria bacterium]|nr:tetratricopeptide repeat protein [Gammaproteobacteria bacterium]MBU1491447.1 tetratricopeptide repeat protein [Gammaproteobacteria bacterium]MBU2216414.1 tetratricopeptide repeat protein [Gammaproteobacteria bacterium]MBU2325515.1 tetratricopeptide repeat protein [Gammaproteobacteria bacterium]